MLMNSVTSDLNTVQIIYSVNDGLRILMMNHIFPIKNLISSRIEMNMLFKTLDERKRRRCDRNIHKAMIIPVYINEGNKKITVTVQQKNACRLEFTDNLWLPVIDQPQSDIVVFQ